MTDIGILPFGWHYVNTSAGKKAVCKEDGTTVEGDPISIWNGVWKIEKERRRVNAAKRRAFSHKLVSSA